MEFPAFRRYEATRQAANNTIQLTTGSNRLLPEIFPRVEHVKYFNLRTDPATQLLLDTGHHLGAVAVPSERLGRRCTRPRAMSDR